jgi:ketopantoate reductase
LTQPVSANAAWRQRSLVAVWHPCTQMKLHAPNGAALPLIPVARAEGVTIPADIEATVLGLTNSMPDQRSSTAQDLMRGKPSEIDHLNGYVVQRGAALGVPTPANRVLWAVTKLVEQP